MDIRPDKKWHNLIATFWFMSSITHLGSASAEIDWISLTLDNDSFVGNDNGYTQGAYFSWYDTPDNNQPEIGFLARAMTWSLPDEVPALLEARANTIGQIVITPEDITVDPPLLPPDDLPYGGMLFYNDTFIKVYAKHADRIGVTLGLIGEYSLAEEIQEFVHEIVDSDEPCCWDTQLDNEIVFQFTRERVWKAWTSDAGDLDILFGTDAALGTITSFIGASVMFRFGSQLDRSFATALLLNSRTANPVATRNGWYLFAGARAYYIGNQIFLDGNTFDDEDDAPIDYDEDALAVTFGLAYSWKDVSFTLALNDLNIYEDSNNDSSEEYSEYGTFTLAWRRD